MKTFIGKTKDEALEVAAKELNVPVENIYVDAIVENKGLFGRIKSVEVTCYTDAMVVEFVQDYLKRIVEKMGIEVKTTPSYTDGLIRIKLSTNHNSILIGKDGETLQALNEVCRNAANATFKKRVRILLDINEYKNEKYAKLSRIAKRVAKEVAATKIEVKLDSMNSYERRIIHNILTNNKKVYTESEGEEPNRYVVIKPKED